MVVKFLGFQAEEGKGTLILDRAPLLFLITFSLQLHLRQQLNREPFPALSDCCLFKLY